MNPDSDPGLVVVVQADPPDWVWVAPVVVLGAIVAVDVWALRTRRWTVSRWCGDKFERYPLAASATAGLLLAHLTGRWRRYDLLHRMAQLLVADGVGELGT